MEAVVAPMDIPLNAETVPPRETAVEPNVIEELARFAFGIPVGKSATTSERNVGADALPVVGPANTELAASVARLIVKVPLVVIEEGDTLRNDGTVIPTLVTVPPPRLAVVTFVMSPLPLTVMTGIAVEDPKLPVVAFTVARVVVIAVVPLPDTSPLRVMVWFAVR